MRCCLVLFLLLSLGMAANAQLPPTAQSNVQTAIDFLHEMGADEAAGAAEQLHDGDYFLGSQMQTNFWNNTEVDRALAAPKVGKEDKSTGKIIWFEEVFVRANCDHFKKIARLAISLMHERIHVGQGAIWRGHCESDCQKASDLRKKGLLTYPHPGHMAEQMAWSETLAEVDRWIRAYREKRLKEKPTLKKLKEEKALIELKQAMLGEYEKGNKKDYGPMAYKYILTRGEVPGPEDPPPPPKSPEDFIIILLDLQLKEVDKLIEECKVAKLENREPRLEGPFSPLPWEGWEEAAIVPPESRCKTSWVTTGQSFGQVFRLKVTNPSQEAAKLVLEPGLRLRIGGQQEPGTVVFLARRLTVPLAPGETAEVPVEVYSLKPGETIAPGQATVIVEPGQSPAGLIVDVGRELEAANRLRARLPSGGREFVVIQEAIWAESTGLPGQSLRMQVPPEASVDLRQDVELVLRESGVEVETRDVRESPLMAPPPEWCPR